jgi:RNA polymerase sigma-70 factor (ECF subfamily)
VSLLGGWPRPGGAQGRGQSGDIASGDKASPTDDDAVVTVLYAKYREPLMTFVLRLTGGDKQHAEDIVQETMIRAWREARRLDLNEASLMPWLTTVAKHIVIDDHRKRQARPSEAGDAMLADVPVQDDTGATLQRLMIIEALKALSPAHREVLNETILRDRTVNQAAEALGLPVGTVKSRVYYALRALQVILAERGVLP